MSKKKHADEIPQVEGEDWVQWLEKQSSAYLASLIIDQQIEIWDLQSQVTHYRKYQMAAAKDISPWRDQFIEVQLTPNPFDGSIPSDAEIAKKAGTTVRVVREIRNKGGDKKPRGRPKKVS
jgi:hypothetical protein